MPQLLHDLQEAHWFLKTCTPATQDKINWQVKHIYIYSSLHCHVSLLETFTWSIIQLKYPNHSISASCAEMRNQFKNEISHEYRYTKLVNIKERGGKQKKRGENRLPVAKLRPSDEKHIPVTESAWPLRVFKSNGWWRLLCSYITIRITFLRSISIS